MSETFVNTVFGENRAEIGATLLGEFTGTSVASGVSTVLVNGTINRPGSQVSIDLNIAGLVGAGLTGTYIGFSQPTGQVEPVYYFSVTPLGLPTPVTVAVSNGPLPTVGIATTVNTNVLLSAPDSPTIVCYATGTRIRTAGGDVCVEDLRPGDLVVTSSGERRPIRWIGHRSIECQGRSDRARVMPVRIARDAFGEGRPARDLYVSPAHAVCVDLLGEVLVPACRLVNGTTVVQVEVEDITYWHIELDSHDILLAEGLPSESYVECGNRRFFANAEVTDLDAVPDTRSDETIPFCRPFRETGVLVDAVRDRLHSRALQLGWRLVETPLADLRIVADGRAVRPEIDGLCARVRLPSGVREVWLECETSVPAHIGRGGDDRALGICLAALTADDGLSVRRTLRADSAELSDGFHEAGEGHRWTTARARVPSSLWEGAREEFFLRIDLAAPALPRWLGADAEQPGLRLVA